MIAVFIEQAGITLENKGDLTFFYEELQNQVLFRGNQAFIKNYTHDKTISSTNETNVVYSNE